MKQTYSRFEFKGAVVRGYDAFNHVSTAGLDLVWRRKTAQFAAYHLVQAPGHILDLACGSGDMALALKRQLPNARITGSEPSNEMLSLLQHKQTFRNIKAVKAVSALPFADAQFDAVTIAFGVRNFTRLDAEMRECLRVLKPGGRLYILEFFQPRHPVLRRFLTLYQRVAFPIIGYLLTGHISQYRYLYKSIVTFKTLPAYKRILNQAGYTNVQSYPLEPGLAHLVTAQKQEINK
ncbi:MAG: ubiquinone/menaquinone biosynthesis methyltransferase [candidate division KSB1 bacterium]|nr:ubiquinone/menaquinone biosynthesis methyltransferase [candidate division KSB1 bacterium]